MIKYSARNLFDDVMAVIGILVIAGVICWVMLTKVQRAQQSQVCVSGYMYRVNPQGVMFPISDGKEFVTCEE